MYELGVSYHEGSHGLDCDDSAAYTWYKMASDSGCVMATAVIGDRLISGTGAPRNVPSGLIHLACAAKDGSDYACYCLGEYYFKGMHGVAKDFELAKYWLEMAVGEDCNFKHITESYISTARRWIRKIEEMRLQAEKRDSFVDETALLVMSKKIKIKKVDRCRKSVIKRKKLVLVGQKRSGEEESSSSEDED